VGSNAYLGVYPPASENPLGLRGRNAEINLVRRTRLLAKFVKRSLFSLEKPYLIWCDIMPVGYALFMFIFYNLLVQVYDRRSGNYILV